MAPKAPIVSIPVLTVIGPVCSTQGDGAKINGLVESILNQGYSVTLDFRGVKLVTPTFYSAVVGNLLNTFPEHEIVSRLQMIDLP